MSHTYDALYNEWRFDEQPCRLVDTCPHGVPDDRHDECADCAAEDAVCEFVQSEKTAVMAIYHEVTGGAA